MKDKATNLQFFALNPSIVSCRKFVSFWSKQYDYSNEKLYHDNIGRPLTKKKVLSLFCWKNNGPLSAKKMASVAKNYIGQTPDLNNLSADLNRSGGAIWRIFWLHCNYPKKFPIYDQHVHRAMTTIKKLEEREIPKRNKDKIDFYLTHYVPFYNSFDETYSDHRMIDKALWSYGKFLRSYSLALMGE